MGLRHGSPAKVTRPAFWWRESILSNGSRGLSTPEYFICSTRIHYTIIPSGEGIGTTDSATSQTVVSASTVQFTLTPPDTDYHIDSVTDCGGRLSGITITTALIIAAYNLSATFTVSPVSIYAKIPSADAGGLPSC